ncbi:hypothetical protein BU24DRAFT_392532 [Aaosphaeria arxii CBS 175.79]|uniref:Uncharacterized protein n=1 Tax=Aaosphaeria arxii CBS 175.79 TaxID=1450172 RepID=A0A6A5XNR0_9PLEO|nr:uncharacterized protein BU24DRAFT_392532 [Aaosphaeria arxii CBS 175.79]KAF2014401.1 hypothetical protein BU24DRAFT_392532 [Aaosphaeria arxii CBS 175.79]
MRPLIAILLVINAATTAVALSGEALAMVEDSTAWMDKFYDPSVGQLYDLESKAAMNHETLTSAWYAVGLLARNGNGGKDVTEAQRIINFIIADQHDNPKDLWYGGYTREPEEPDVGSEHYPAKAYGSFDPNWRGFVGLSFITMYEDFGDLLSEDLKRLMLESLFNCSIGDSYREGGVNGDNLWPSYSNPAIMRAIGTGWTGRKTGDKNMTKAGEDYAQKIIDLWDMHNTLSEFNSATYTGISIFGLTLWAKYMPEDSIMAKRGPGILSGVWNTTSQLWHADMRNLAGPWDRSYSLDMTIHLGHLSLFLASIIGRKAAGLHQYPEIMSHARDWAWAPLIAVHSEFHNSLLSDELKNSLKTFDGDRVWKGQAYYPPHDLDTRNITTWMGKTLMIGAQSYHTKSKNGPSNNNGQFHPAVAQWMYGEGKIGWLSLRSSQAHVQVEVSANRLKITYPEGGADSVFTFFVSPSMLQPNVKAWADIQGISISVTGNVDEKYDLKFAGRYGGELSPWYDHNYWRFEYKMPAVLNGSPELVIDFAPPKPFNRLS